MLNNIQMKSCVTRVIPSENAQEQQLDFNYLDQKKKRHFEVWSKVLFITPLTKA